MPAVELQHGFVAALIGIVNDRDGLLPDGVPSAVDAGDQEEATRYAFPSDGHTVSHCCRARPSWAIEQYRNTQEARNGLLLLPRGRSLE